MEAVIAANPSIFNLTAQFRNLLTQFGLATRFNVEVYGDKYEITHLVLISCIPTLIAYAAILPISLSLVLIEKLLVSPFINLVEGCLPDKHNDFIEEVVWTASTLG